MSYKKNASSNRDALFGPSSGGGAASSSTTKAGGGTTAGKSRGAATTAAAPSPLPPPVAVTNNRSNNNAGYTSTTQTSSSRRAANSRSNLLSGEARAAKVKEAEDYKAKAKSAMSTGFLKRPDPLMASTYYKRAADCYKTIGDRTNERYYRVSSGQCHALVGAFASAANEYARAADLVMEKLEEEDEVLSEQDCIDACSYHKLASDAWKSQGDTAKAAQSTLKAALCLNASAKGTMLSQASLQQMEEAVEMHVPDVLNPFAKYRQTGHSSFVDPDSDETVEKPREQTLAMAREHLVSRSYAHEPLQQLVAMLARYGEYASALYASGAVSTLLSAEGISTLSLSRAYVVETVLQLAMGDPVAAEQTFLQRHCNSRPYLSSREAQLAEELTQAIKRRDPDLLEEARSPQGRNRAAMANLDPSLRDVVGQLRISGVARKAVSDTAYSEPATAARSSSSSHEGGSSSAGAGPSAAAAPGQAPAPPSLQEVLKKKTGYEEADAEEGAALDGDQLAAELDGLDFGDDNSGSTDGGGSIGGGDDDSDDDIDLR